MIPEFYTRDESGIPTTGTDDSAGTFTPDADPSTTTDPTLVDSDEGGEPLNRYGHLLSFCVAGGAPAARQVLDRLQLVLRATDLGRIKSIATIPAISTHQQQGEEGRDLACIPANMIRLCVGGEHPEDIVADLAQALDF